MMGMQVKVEKTRILMKNYRKKGKEEKEKAT